MGIDWGFVAELDEHLKGESLDPAYLEQSYQAVERLIVDALLADERDALEEGWRRLRRIYGRLAAALPADYDKRAEYHLGRIVELVEVAEAASQRTSDGALCPLPCRRPSRGLPS